MPRKYDAAPVKNIFQPDNLLTSATMINPDNAALKLLVVVHPGSACGSADYNLGKVDARSARDTLCFELDRWTGGVIVIDGALSDELQYFPSLNTSIASLLSRAKASGAIGIREYGDDPDQMALIKDIVQRLGETGVQAQYSVTGAWYHPEDASGCVGSVIDALTEIGCQASVSASAVSMSLNADEPDDELDQESNGGPQW